MTVKKKFTIEDVNNQIRNDLQSINDSLLESFELATKNVVETAKANQTYDDQTGDLTSSIGYIIFHDGQEVTSYFGATSTVEGITQGLATARSKPEIYNCPGIVIIIVAGMEYASTVENSGYDVISGSLAHFESTIQQCFNEVKLKYQ